MFLDDDDDDDDEEDEVEVLDGIVWDIFEESIGDNSLEIISEFSSFSKFFSSTKLSSLLLLQHFAISFDDGTSVE